MSQRADRFLFIDGLRGVAATVVMVGHLAPPEAWAGVAAALPTGAQPHHLLGALGVKIFFAISGFVIAHSLRGTRITPGFAGNFALRRSLRLDPPFWATVLLAVAASRAAGWLLPGWQGAQPGWDSVLAHLGYVYPFLGYAPIVDVFWTLVLEVQFYLAFLALLAVAQRLAGDGPRAAAAYRRWLAALLVGTAVLSEAAPLPPFPYFLSFWHEFAIGAVCYLFHARLLAAAPLLALLAIKAGLLAHAPAFDKAVTLGTGVALVAASLTGNLARWLGAAPLQFLGAISYSLYLMHDVVGLRVKHLAHRVHLPGGDLTGALLAMAASLLAAWLMWRFIECPSVALAKRFRHAVTPYPLPDASWRARSVSDRSLVLRSTGAQWFFGGAPIAHAPGSPCGLAACQRRRPRERDQTTSGPGCL